jgi:tetratricopeptide (TPR) repeat protein
MVPRTPDDNELNALWQMLRVASFDQITEQRLDHLRTRLAARTRRLRGEDALLARCLLSEAYDYLARFAKARDVVAQDAERLVPILAGYDGESATPSDLEVTVVVHYACSLYRHNNFVQADRLLMLCEGLCQGKPDIAPRFDILARIAYCRGQIARQETRFDEALRHFSFCIDTSIQSFDLNKGKISAEERRRRYLFTTHAVGKAMIMGIGWLYFNQGELRNARPLILSGQILVEPSADTIPKAFAAMILGCIERSAGGKQEAALDGAIPKLRKAHEVFQKRNQRYQAVAAFYLAVALHHKGQLDEAEAYAETIKKLRPGDLQWEANSDILLSRIARTRYAEESNPRYLALSIDFAREALAKASRGGRRLAMVDAQIAVAEAQFGQGHKDQAKTAFQEAAEASQKMKNPKSLGACYLHLARIHIVEGDMAAARLQLERWHELEPFIENGLLRSWASQIEKDLEDLRADFRISVETSAEDLQYTAQVKKLQMFLFRLALERAGGDKSKAAAILGVSRHALYKWTEPKRYGYRPKGDTPIPEAEKINDRGGSLILSPLKKGISSP